MVWFELTTGHSIEVEHNAYVDELSLIMILIIGIIGTLICVYAMGYMKDFQHHQPAGSKGQKTLVLLPAVPVPGCNGRSCNFKQL